MHFKYFTFDKSCYVQNIRSTQNVNDGSLLCFDLEWRKYNVQLSFLQLRYHRLPCSYSFDQITFQSMYFPRSKIELKVDKKKEDIDEFLSTFRFSIPNSNLLPSQFQ